MKRATWEIIAPIAERALALEGDARRELVAAAIADRPELAEELARIIDALEGADGFVDGLARRFDELVDPLSLDIGDELGPYRIERSLGRGGMGAVYLARRADAQFDKTVAIKILPSTVAADDARRRFLEERQILAGLEHPAIARLLDGGVSPAGLPYFVLEYVDGSPVDRYADSASLDELLGVVRQICEAVAYAHGRLVIHCDIKPANVLVGGNAQVKLLDFGIARAVSAPNEGGRLRYLDTPVTRNYAAPELLEGGPLDTRADVYSLGVLMFRLLAGRPPYTLPAGSLDLAQVRIPCLTRTGTLRSASRVMLAELDTIIANATAHDPVRRTASAHELADQIDRVRTHVPLAKRPDGIAAYRLRKGIRRNPIAAALAIASIALGVAAIAALTTGIVVARDERLRAEDAGSRATRESETSRQVVDFVVSIFDAADPELRTAGARPVSARELLDAGIARIEHAGISSPEVSARLRLTMGSIARKLGEYARAEVMLARAIDEGDDVVRHQALLELGLNQASRGDNAAARISIERAVAACAAIADRGCTIDALRVKGALAIDRGDPAAARVALTEALALARTHDPTTRKERARIALITYDLGTAAHKAAEFVEATRLYTEAQQLFRAIEGAPTVDAATSYLNLGSVKHARGEDRDALPLLVEARRIFAELYGPSHLRVAYVDFLAADVYAKLQRFEESAGAAKAAVAVRSEALGDAHSETGMAWGRLADALAGLGRDAEALDAAERSRSITRQTAPTSYANVGITVARLQARLGRAADAVATARETIAIHERLFGSEHAMMVRGHSALAQALSSSGDPSGAIASSRRALAIADAKLRPDHPRRVSLLVDLGELESRAGRKADARATLERALELASAAQPPQAELVARARALLETL